MPLPPPPPGRPAAAALLAPALALALCGALVWNVRMFFTDDAYISLRFALRFARGDGPVWNAGGPPDEGFSNPLLVAAEALVLRLGGDGVTFARGLGVSAALATILTTWAVGRRLVGDRVAGWASLLVGGSPAIAFWAVGGLETSVVTLLLSTGALLACVPGAELVGALVLAPLPWLRPEALGLILPLAGALVLTAGTTETSAGPSSPTPALRRGLTVAGPAILSNALLQAARVGLYGHVLPNSAVFKARMGSGDSITLNFLEEAWPVLVLAVPGLWTLPRALRPLAAPALVLLGASPFFLNSVNEYSRFLLPSWPLWALLAAQGAGAVAGWAERRSGAPRPIVEGALVVVAGAWIALGSPASVTETRWLADRYATCKTVARANAGDWLRANQAPGDVYAIADAGLVPWRADGTAYDIFGLNDPEVQVDGYMEPEPRAARVLERAPEWIVLTSGLEDTLSPRYEVERAIARSPEFQRRYTLAENVDGRACRYWLRIYRRVEAPS